MSKEWWAGEGRDARARGGRRATRRRRAQSGGRATNAKRRFCATAASSKLARVRRSNTHTTQRHYATTTLGHHDHTPQRSCNDRTNAHARCENLHHSRHPRLKPAAARAHKHTHSAIRKPPAPGGALGVRSDRWRVHSARERPFFPRARGRRRSRRASLSSSPSAPAATHLPPPLKPEAAT
jgi:hypothetical protein